jgi:hypothetical protein
LIDQFGNASGHVSEIQSVVEAALASCVEKRRCDDRAAARHTDHLPSGHRGRGECGRWCGNLEVCAQLSRVAGIHSAMRLVPIAIVLGFVTSAFAQTAGVKSHRDLVYVEGGHERHKLDLYLPEKADGPLPLIIWVHGGGWQNGSKDGCPPLRGGYIERGYAVASINYRLSGHAVFPAQIEDCKAAIRWLRAHAKEYGLDAKRFGVWGSSAGGHLVALLGTSGDVKEFDVGANLDQSSRVQAVCDYYGPTDFTVFVTTPGYESHAADSSLKRS